MLDLKFIRDNAELIRKNSKDRLSSVDIDRLLEVDRAKRETETQLDSLRAERNKASKSKPSSEVIEQMKKTGEDIKALETKLAGLEPELRELWYAVPNLTHPKVVVSADEDANPVLETFGEPTKFDFVPKDHVELGVALDLIDFDRATKVSGAKFYYLKNELALLEFALIQYALETLYKEGFTPFSTPDLAKSEVLEGLGFNPRGDATNTYSVENTDLCLIGTAEVTMGGYHMDEIFTEADLPKKYAAVSHCFRTEAGAYSRFSKGIFRVHQFTKIEMFIYTLPEQSERAHQELLAMEKKIWQGLDIPFRVIDHCTADLGGPSYRTYDLEAWMPGKPASPKHERGEPNKEGKMGDWAEVTSTSNCTDYQARGLNIKYRDEAGEKKFVHMLNGTAIAVSRALIAILENNQEPDGSVVIPEVLRKYLPGKLEKISRK
jgi:seryl-tRNA synthetase